MKIRKLNLACALFSAAVVGWSIANNHALGAVLNVLCVWFNILIGWEEDKCQP